MNTARALRAARRLLAGQRGSAAPFRAQRRIAGQAALLVRVFYAANLYLVLRDLRLAPGWLAAAAIDPLWPVAWIRWTGIAPGVHAILGLALLGAFTAALWPDRRPARALAFAGLLLLHAFANSFGKINHSSHGWVLAAFLLVFLPGGGRAARERSRAVRQLYLNAFWSAQAMLLLIYTMSGVWKLLEAFPQLVRGEVHAFAPTALSLHIAHRLLQTADESLLGAFFIGHPWLAWPGFLLTLYLQVTALPAAFRPSLHRLWGAGHLAFHAMVYLTLAVPFHPQVLLVGILLLASPFEPGCGWRRRAAELPLVGALARRASGRIGAAQAGEAEQALDGPLGSHRVGDL